MELYDIAIIGGGIAGYTAALTAKNLGLGYLWLAPEAFGEKTRAAEYVRNFPSFSGNGVAFCSALETQRGREGVELTRARADGVFAQGGGYLISAGKEMFSARTVVLATGVDLKGGVKGEREFFGRGVSYCAVCDGALYRGKTVAAVLSSPRYEEEAEYLASLAETVHCFCPYGEPHFKAKNIVVHAGMPEAIGGGARVEQIIENGKALSVSGVFLLKDSTPVRALCGGLETDGAHIITKKDGSTNLAGLFAAGDVTGPPYQYAKAAGEGLVAAYSARAYLSALKKH